MAHLVGEYGPYPTIVYRASTEAVKIRCLGSTKLFSGDHHSRRMACDISHAPQKLTSISRRDSCSAFSSFHSIGVDMPATHHTMSGECPPFQAMTSATMRTA